MDELREMIASIDKDIVELIATRMEIADELGRAKKQANDDYRNPEVESQVIKRYLELSQEVDISEDDARKIAEAILEISLARQKKITE
ncbi:MAG: chorismate mutase [Candidatus Methanomethylophilaceae archaeon]|jgi:chorismate mutase